MSHRKAAAFALSLLIALPLLAQRKEHAATQPKQAPEHAQQEHGPQAAPQHNGQFPAPPAKEESSKTQHTIRVNGQELHYTAIAGTLLLRDEAEKPKASIFYIYYALDGANPASRPLTFAFNGGPARHPYGCTWARWDRSASRYLKQSCLDSLHRHMAQMYQSATAAH